MDPKDIGKAIGEELLAELRLITAQLLPAEDERDEDMYRDSRLSDRQAAQYEAIEDVVEIYGKYDQSAGPDGAHYSSDNPFLDDGIACENCVYYQDNGNCEVVTGNIDPDGICKLWIIPDTQMVPDMEPDNENAAESYAIPEAVKNNAKRGLELHKKYGRGGTSVGMNTARILSGGGSIGIEKVRHINRYFPRHAGDNLDDKTSNGWIAWLLWGGDAGRRWAAGIVKRVDGKQG